MPKLTWHICVWPSVPFSQMFLLACPDSVWHAGRGSLYNFCGSTYPDSFKCFCRPDIWYSAILFGKVGVYRRVSGFCPGLFHVFFLFLFTVLTHFIKFRYLFFCIQNWIVINVWMNMEMRYIIRAANHTTRNDVSLVVADNSIWFYMSRIIILNGF